MLADIAKRKTTGQLRGPEPDHSILMVVAFVETHLETFAEEYSGTSIRNEKGLTQKLCILLDKQARVEGRPFLFDKEHMEAPEKGDGPAVDIGVITSLSEGIFIHSKWYGGEESFFSIEAKRLDVISKAREKEYLVGRWESGKYKNCGGVERFKKGIHGRGLHYSAIIGYVQRYDFEYWYCTINSWIDEFIAGDNPSDYEWSNDDKLVEIRKTVAVAKYRSKNSRKNGPITLFHLWVNLPSARGGVLHGPSARGSVLHGPGIFLCDEHHLKF